MLARQKETIYARKAKAPDERTMADQQLYNLVVKQTHGKSSECFKLYLETKLRLIVLNRIENG